MLNSFSRTSPFPLRLLVVSLAMFLPGRARNGVASEFISIGDLPGATFYSTAEGVSDDGKFVVGESRSTESGERWREAFVWTEDDAMIGLGHLGNGPLHSAIAHVGSGISGDGRVIVGRSGRGSSDGGMMDAFLWTASDEMIGLGDTPDGHQTWASSTSENGEVVIGGTQWSDRPWYWTEDEGVQNLTDIKGTATQVSADGEVIVGWTVPSRPQTHAFRWTRENGLEGLDPPDGFDEASTVALSVSPDGSAIVGQLRIDGVIDPFLWTEESGMQQLGPLSGRGHAYGVSNNGEIVVGGPSGAFIWNENLGILDLKAVLEDEYGLSESLKDWELSVARDISPDGRFIVGIGTNPQGHTEGWLVRLDYPFLGSPVIGDLNDDKIVDVLDLDLLGVAIRSNSEDSAFDLDESGEVGPSDITAMIETILSTWIGDSNLDGEFNSRDLVTVFQSSQYEDSINGNSSWETGDWNLDGDFTTADLVFAFQDGGYEKGPRAAPVAVPEPGTLTSILIGLLVLIRLAARD